MTRIFGAHNLALAEDVVQDAFCRALEVWKFGGVPANPSAWLIATAKHRALDIVRRERTARTFAPELERLLAGDETLDSRVDDLFGGDAIKDDRLRMMFSCCDPRLPENAQLALILALLCGFSVAEIAAAFMSGRAAIEKRLSRAKRVLAQSQTLFDLDGGDDFGARLPAVGRALYLLFNEGYHGASADSAVRVELCREAIRLGALLRAHRHGPTPEINALCALMCLHAARLPARVDASGALISHRNQDRARWNRRLIAEGNGLLERSATGKNLSPYHIEAAIASVHARSRSSAGTDWNEIVGLYDTLFTLQPSPVVALNRAIAIGQRDGAERGLEAIHAINGSEMLAAYPFYHAALGELELSRDCHEVAQGHFRSALALARNGNERGFFQQRLKICDRIDAETPSADMRPAHVDRTPSLKNLSGYASTGA